MSHLVNGEHREREIVSTDRQLVAIVGPTAGGKTAAALAIAREVPAEVVSADSRQIRAGMAIGTAAPTPSELAAVPHHLIGVAAPDEPWGLHDFLARARVALEEIWARGRLPLVVGGTGQYVWALLEGWQVPAIAPNPALRAALEAEAAANGPAPLHARLAAIDAASAERIGTTNARRLIRAIEIVEATGKPVAPLVRGGPGFHASIVGLQWDRAAIHAQADARAVAMYDAGLVGETRGLLARYDAGLPALRTIGYAEAARVVAGEWTVPQAIRQTQIETHRLIRMQAAWFRPDDARIDWVPAADPAAMMHAVLDHVRQARTGAAVEAPASRAVR